MTIFLLIAFAVLFTGCWVMGFYAEVVPLLGTLLTPLIIVCVIAGVLALIFTAVELRNKIKGKGKKDKE